MLTYINIIIIGVSQVFTKLLKNLNIFFGAVRKLIIETPNINLRNALFIFMKYLIAYNETKKISIDINKYYSLGIYFI